MDWNAMGTALIGQTGNVREARGEVCVEWNIPDFLSLSGDVDSCYQSPVFCISDSCWRLCIYPNGRKMTPDWVGLSVKREDSGSPRIMTVSFGIKRADGMQERSMSGTFKDMSENFARGWATIILISDLQSSRSELVPSDVLTVTCRFRNDVPHPTEVSLFTRQWNLSRDLERMLDEGKGADFAFKLKKGRELRAHGKILDARCSGFFAGMIANDFQVNAFGMADIEDIEEDVFRCILSYLYTGEATGMSDRNVCKIYVAADKLFLEELKKLCAYYMKENLTLDLICDVVTIVEKYDEAELNERTLDYIIEHAKEVFDSEGWKTFSNENSHLVAKYLEKFAVWRRT